MAITSYVPFSEVKDHFFTKFKVAAELYCVAHGSGYRIEVTAPDKTILFQLAFEKEDLGFAYRGKGFVPTINNYIFETLKNRLEEQLNKK